MLPFDPPENIRKPKVFCFQGDQKGILGRKGLNEDLYRFRYGMKLKIVPQSCINGAKG